MAATKPKIIQVEEVLNVYSKIWDNSLKSFPRSQGPVHLFGSGVHKRDAYNDKAQHEIHLEHFCPSIDMGHEQRSMPLTALTP